MIVSTRPGGKNDDGVIAELRRSAGQESSRYRGHLDDLFHSARRVTVAEVAGEVIGAAWWGVEAGICTIALVHVAEEAREVGAGDALVQSVLAECALLGATSVRSHALPGDRATKNLFERNGLVARAIQVERKLG